MPIITKARAHGRLRAEFDFPPADLVPDGAPTGAADEAAANPNLSNRGREMPTELRKPPERESTDLERYGRWQDVLMFVGLLLLCVVFAEWLWRG